MNKNIFRTIGSLLIISALVISLIPASDVEAQTSASDFQMEKSTLVKYTGTDQVVYVPDDVRSIGEEAFAGNNNVVKVIVNDKCKYIGYGAFANCNSLHGVTVGDGVEEIDSAAFSNDKSLKNVSLGSNVKKLGSAVFAGDTSLTNLTVSDANKYLKLKDNVLYDDELKKLYAMLPSYEAQVFDMPSSVEEVKGYAFWGNKSLKNVNLSSSLYSVPEYAFSNCSSLKQVTIPLPVRSIDSKAFEDCVNLVQVNCPDSLTFISDTAFDGCPNVTLSASAGSYADNFGQSLVKEPIDEVEYEDVQEASIVAEETVVRPMPEAENENVVVVVDKNGNTESAMTGVMSTPTPIVNGVINGADMVSYRYGDPKDEPNGPLLGSSSIVSGRALVFIDNDSYVRNGADMVPKNDNDTEGISEEILEDDSNGAFAQSAKNSENKAEDNMPIAEAVGQVLDDTSSKKSDFPKFTLVNHSVASQAYYKDTSLEEYSIPEDITNIGDFAFARSSLRSIKIPDGVTSIGYGAFYHCDDLMDVEIPSSVTEVSSYAFDKTPIIDNSPDAFVVIGDGVLIAYKGNDSVVTIPDGVKVIADSTFKDHMGITAVNLSDSVKIIGEDAFRNCKNLKTLNRTDSVEEIGANAFKGTALTNITIGENVKTIGLGAFDIEGGTDTVTFNTDVLPAIKEGRSTARLANKEDRSYVFGDISKAIVRNPSISINDTVLEPGKYGFKGKVMDEVGSLVSDNTSGVYMITSPGVAIALNSAYIDAKTVRADIPGDEDSYCLHITDSQNAKENITSAYKELYGGESPTNLIGLDISLRDSSDLINIKKLGKQKVNVTINLPVGVHPDNLNVVCLDGDGQLESVDYSLDENNKEVTFECEHFSYYGLYNYINNNEKITKTGDRIKDDTPDTGDIPIHPKWFLVLGCVALAVVLFLVGEKKHKNTH